jgi:hypothetical protein
MSLLSSIPKEAREKRKRIPIAAPRLMREALRRASAPLGLWCALCDLELYWRIMPTMAVRRQTALREGIPRRRFAGASWFTQGAGNLVPVSSGTRFPAAHLCPQSSGQYPGDLVGLAALLGHSSLDTTRLYSQPSVEQLATPVEQLNINAYVR